MVGFGYGVEYQIRQLVLANAEYAGCGEPKHYVLRTARRKRGNSHCEGMGYEQLLHSGFLQLCDCSS